jgi:hypothetical protein
MNASVHMCVDAVASNPTLAATVGEYNNHARYNHNAAAASAGAINTDSYALAHCRGAPPAIGNRE